MPRQMQGRMPILTFGGLETFKKLIYTKRKHQRPVRNIFEPT